MWLVIHMQGQLEIYTVTLGSEPGPGLLSVYYFLAINHSQIVCLFGYLYVIFFSLTELKDNICHQ